MKCCKPVGFLIAIAAVTLVRCSNTTNVAGNSSSETTNGVTAAIVYSNGTPAAHAVVRVRASDYLADTTVALAKSLTMSDDILTDDFGRFKIDSLDTGKYLIEAVDAYGNAVAIPFTVIKDSLVNLGNRTLSPMGTIAGSAGGPFVKAVVRVRGLERGVRLDRDGRFAVTVPSGQSYIVNFSTQDSSADLTPTQPIASSQSVVVNADFGHYRTDSLAVRAFLDSSGLQAVRVDSVTVVSSPVRRITALHLTDRNLYVLHQSIGSLVFLNELRLSGNKLTDLPATLARLSHLYHLYIDSLPMTRLPDCVAQIRSLTLLDINNTQITTLPTSLSACTSLNVISMRGTGATEFPMVVVSMSWMSTLNISENPISTIPSGIGACTSLQHIEFHDTQIDSLPASIGTLRNLRSIFAYRSRLTTLPASIGMLSALEIVGVGSCVLNSLPPELGDCAALKILNLDNNALDSLPAKITNLTALTSLTIAGNHLCTLPTAIAAWADTYAEPSWRTNQTCP